MSDPLFPDESLEIRFRRIEKQLSELQRSPRVANITTISGGIQISTITTAEVTTSTAFEDLDTIGPTVSVQVPGTGRVLVQGSAQVTFSPATAGGPHGGRMAIATPTSVENLIRVSIGNVPVTLDVDFTQSSSVALENLSPGILTLKLVYLALSGTAAPVTFANRTLSVLPL